MAINADRSLWRAVVAQAFTDLMMPPSQGSRKSMRKVQLIREQAKVFLTEASEDLTIVCGLAELEPHKVIEKARAMLAGKVIFNPTET